MTQRIRFQLSGLPTNEEIENLRKLLDNFMARSDELEKKESQALQQVELLQSALSSMQDWNKGMEEKSYKAANEIVHVNLEEIEEETKKIKTETDRIRKEILEKIQANKKLQDEIDKRKAEETGVVDEFVTESFINNMEEETKRITQEREGHAESRTIETDLKKDPGIQYMNEKLKKLEEMQSKLKRESEEETKEMRKRRRELKEKIEMLEWESEVDRQLLRNLKKKFDRH